MYHTNSPSCVYDVDMLKSMQKSGCTFRVNGKAAQPKDINDLIRSASTKTR